MSALDCLIEACEYERHAANLAAQSDPGATRNVDDLADQVMRATYPVAVLMRLTLLSEVKPGTCSYLDPTGGTLLMRRGSARGFEITGYLPGAWTLATTLVGQMSPEVFPMRLFFVERTERGAIFFTADRGVVLLRELDRALVVESFASIEQWCIDCNPDG